MGRLESLTAWALGRGPYEDEVIFADTVQETPGGHRQLYNAHGHPRNPETKRREREGVRAANEVMQVTGVVEDALLARMKARAYQANKNKETFAGIRLMDTGRTVLICGVWGVLGLRRRILLYNTYSSMNILDIMQRESAVKPLWSWQLSGVPTVLIYHLTDHIELYAQEFVDWYWNDEKEDSARYLSLKALSQKTIGFFFGYITLHLRMFAMLQQLNLIPGSRMLPSIRAFIPFSRNSPLRLPPSPSFNVASILSWQYLLIRSAAPLIVIFAHGRLRSELSSFLYPSIFRSLPHPTGGSIFDGAILSQQSSEPTAPARVEPPTDSSAAARGEDEPTLRALEGLPIENPTNGVSHSDQEQDQLSSDDEEGDIPVPALISFEIEATEALESSHGFGSWSAELRSANDPGQPKEVAYYVTGLTILPTVLAAEGLREVISGVLVLPLEAFMVRILGAAYRASAGASVEDLYSVGFGNLALGNLITALAMQLVLTGATWGIYTGVIGWWAERKRTMFREALEKVELA